MEQLVLSLDASLICLGLVLGFSGGTVHCYMVQHDIQTTSIFIEFMPRQIHANLKVTSAATQCKLDALN